MNAIYARQSVDKKDSLSIETQIDICKKEFDDKSVYKVYPDKGYSGKDTNRPKFEEMINDIKNGLISKVIVYRLDRISRSTLDFAKIIDVFKKYNIDFISTTEKFDTSTPIGKAILQIIMIFAELERETIQQRITDNYYARGKKGYGLGGTIPYGFVNSSIIIKDKKTSMFKEDPLQSIWIKEMYDLYGDTKMSLRKLCFYLNDKNVPAPNGGKWDSNKISRILRNPIYVKADSDVYLYFKNKGAIISNDISEFIGESGCFLYGKRDRSKRKYTDVTEHTLSIALHEGIVDSDIWLLCQYKLDSNKQIKNTGKSKYTWLSGLIKCGYCGYTISLIASNGGRYKYLRCSHKVGSNACKGFSRPIKAEQVESVIEERIFEKLEGFKEITIEIKSNKNNDLNKMKLKIIDIDNKINNLVKQIAEGNKVVMRYINAEITNLDSEKSEIMEQLKKFNLQNKGEQHLKDVLGKVQGWNTMDLEDKKEIAQALIEKIHLKDDEIKIDWKV